MEDVEKNVRLSHFARKWIIGPFKCWKIFHKNFSLCHFSSMLSNHLPSEEYLKTISTAQLDASINCTQIAQLNKSRNNNIHNL